ncbi:MAG: hypothetical protein IJ220_08860 [Clostridia bacterium]|nr:hypothetical protein [Clostridia bacterium]
MDFQYDISARAFTYEEEINQAILEDTNQFDYHGHTFLVEKNKEGNYDILSNGKKVSEAMVEDMECIVEKEEGQEDYIRNTKADYYDILYQDIFRKVRTKEYGISSKKRKNEDKEVEK